MSYIYLIQEREHIRLNEPTYKIGKTHQKPGARMGAYPKDSSLKIMLNFNNCDTAEKELLVIFKKKFTHKPEYGYEYFLGSVNEMIKTIMDYWNTINSNNQIVSANINNLVIRVNSIPSFQPILNNMNNLLDMFMKYMNIKN